MRVWFWFFCVQCADACMPQPQPTVSSCMCCTPNPSSHPSTVHTQTPQHFHAPSATCLLCCHVFLCCSVTRCATNRSGCENLTIPPYFILSLLCVCSSEFRSKLNFLSLQPGILMTMSCSWLSSGWQKQSSTEVWLRLRPRGPHCSVQCKRVSF